MLNKKIDIARMLSVAAAFLFMALPLRAQSSPETSHEVRFQLDCHVPDAVLRALLPQGFTPDVAPAGPAKDANLRVIFVDRLTDDVASGGSSGGSLQWVYLQAPVKDASGAHTQLVLTGLTSAAAAAPGPLKTYTFAPMHTFSRSVTNATGKVIETQDWTFAVPGAERVELHIQFERGSGFHLGPFETKLYSGAGAAVAQTWRQEEHLDILRNATTNPRDRVMEFRFKATGGSFAPLFEGKEKLLSWDNILWFDESLVQ